MQNKEKAKKLIIITVGVVILILIILYTLTVVLEHIRESGFGAPFKIPEDTSEYIYFYPPDYNVDISSDTIYTTLNHSIMYIQNGLGIVLTEDILDDYGAQGHFFYDYFNALIQGDYQNYPAFFTDDYLKTTGVPDKFTPQKIYDIEVTFYDRDVVNQAPVIYRDYFEVRYKIRHNNGTLRNDVGSDVIKPIVFELIVENDKAQIDKVYPIRTIIVPDEDDE